MVSCQLNDSAPCSRLSASSQVTKFPVVHPLSIQQVTKCFFCNSFVLKTIHFDGGVYTPCGAAPQRPSSPRLPISYPLSPLYSHFSVLFCTFLHSSKNQLFFFRRFRTLLQKTAQRGIPPIHLEGQNEPSGAKFQPQ